MKRSDELALAERLLSHAEAGTTDMGRTQSTVPVSTYTDPAVWHDEIERIYKRKPIVAALSCELPEPGAFLASTIVGVPILITRTADGSLKAFLNVCRHRGAQVVEDGCRGRQSRFSCPYHSWTYDNQGRLVGVTAAETFGPVDRATLGLTELAVGESCGMIFVVLTPGISFDARQWLGSAGEHIAGENIKDYVYVGSRTVRAGNWKLVVEGHLESYHFDTLHRDSIAPFMTNNCTTLDRFGAHVLITFASKDIGALRSKPREEWQPLKDDFINPQYMIFPSTMFVLSHDSVIAQIIHPGTEPGRSTSRLVYAHEKQSANAARDEAALAKLDQVAALVEDEDYAASLMVQRGLTSGAQSEIRFGLNEVGLTMFHESLAQQLEQAHG